MLIPALHAHQGSLTFFTGPMMCGKTLELVRHLQIFQEQRIPLVCLRPSMDTRTPTVQSRAGLLHDAVAVASDDLTSIAERMRDPSVIGIDELQFFPVGLIPLLEQELRRGKTILVAGLDTDFRGIPFPVSHALMAIPETNIQRSRSVCAVCRTYSATRTQRLCNGEPVAANAPSLIVEGTHDHITYEARCLTHHAVR